MEKQEKVKVKMPGGRKKPHTYEEDIANIINENSK